MTFHEKIAQIDDLQQVIAQHGPMLQEVRNKINYKFRLEWNYNSNKAEGNTLTREETRSVMIGNINVANKPIKDVLEMKGHDEVITTLLKMGKGELNISESRIREIHKGIMHEENPDERQKIGVWKAAPNEIINYKGEKFAFVAPEQVKEQMHQLINWLNAEKEKISRDEKAALHPVALAFQFHLDYLTIHPFYDGNGRTARILTNLILISYGYSPIYLKEAETKIYYQYLADIQGYGGSPEVFYAFMADLLIRSQQLVLDALNGKDIEEPEDWEKQLRLLKKQLQEADGAQTVRSEETVKEVFLNVIFPLIKKVMDKLSGFDELFAEKNLQFGNQSSTRLIRTMEQVKSLVADDAERYTSGHEVTFQYRLNGFKKAGTNTFSCSVQLLWRFEQFKYLLYLDHDDHIKAVVRLYHQFYSEEELNGFTNECGRLMLAKMQKQLNDQ